MASIIDALMRTVQEGMEAYQGFQLGVKPQLEEKQRVRALARLEDAHALYGSPQAAFERLGDEYLTLRRAAGLIVPGTREEPITERAPREVPGTEIRKTLTPRYRTRGPFEDVATPGTLTRPTAPASRLRSLTDVLRPTGEETEQISVPGMVGEGSELIRPSRPLMEEGEEEVPTTRTVYEDRPTGRTRRVLDVPQEKELTVDTPAGPIKLSRLREWGGPEAVRHALGITDPVARARLAFDIQNAQIGRTLQQARLDLDEFMHENPSASARLTAQVNLTEARWRMLDQNLDRALATQNAADLRTYRQEQLKLQREANAIRFQAMQNAARRLRTGQMTMPQMVTYLNSLRQDIDDEQSALEGLDPKLDADEVAETKERIEDLREEQKITRQLIKSMRGGGVPPPPVRGELNYPSFAPGAGGPFALRGGGELGGPAPAGAAAATVVTPAPAGPGVRASYQTRYSGSRTAPQIRQAIDQMIRMGYSRERIRAELAQDSIPPEDFGYGPR